MVESSVISESDSAISALIERWIDHELLYEIAKKEGVPLIYIESSIRYFLYKYYGEEQSYNGDIAMYKEWFAKIALRNYHHLRVR